MNVSVASKTVHYVCQLYRNQCFWNRCHIILPAKPTKKKTYVGSKETYRQRNYIYIYENTIKFIFIVKCCKHLQKVTFFNAQLLLWTHLVLPLLAMMNKEFFSLFLTFCHKLSKCCFAKKKMQSVYCVPKSNCIIFCNSRYFCFIQNPSTTKATTPRFTFGNLFKWVAMPTDTVVYNKHQKNHNLPTCLDKVRECKGAKRSPPPKVGDNMKPPKVENVAWRGRVSHDEFMSLWPNRKSPQAPKLGDKLRELQGCEDGHRPPTDPNIHGSEVVLDHSLKIIGEKIHYLYMT